MHGATTASRSWCVQPNVRSTYSPDAPPEGLDNLRSLRASVSSSIKAAVQKPYYLPEAVFADAVCLTEDTRGSLYNAFSLVRTAVFPRKVCSVWGS